jgi:GNAT superfamily N-acetyltransferase
MGTPTLQSVVTRFVPATRPWLGDRLRGWCALRLERLAYRRLLLFERDLSVDLPPQTSDVDCTVRRLGLADLPAYLAFYPAPHERVFRSRIAQGQRCYAACANGKILSSVWAVFEQALFPGIESVWRLGPAAVYTHDSYTAPELRGHNLATLLRVSVLQQLREEGVRRAVLFVWPENASGLRPPAKTGYTRCGSIGWFGLCRRGLYFLRLAGKPTRWVWRFRRGRGPLEF